MATSIRPSSAWTVTLVLAVLGLLTACTISTIEQTPPPRTITCLDGKTVSHPQNCPEVQAFLLHNSSEKLDCTKPENQHTELVLLHNPLTHELNMNISTDGWGVFGKWYPSLKEGWLMDYDVGFTNGGCTRIPFHQLHSTSYVLKDGNLIASEDAALYDLGDQFNDPNLAITDVLPGDRAFNVRARLTREHYGKLTLNGTGTYEVIVIAYNENQQQVIGFLDDKLDLK